MESQTSGTVIRSGTNVWISSRMRGKCWLANGLSFFESLIQSYWQRLLHPLKSSCHLLFMDAFSAVHCVFEGSRNQHNYLEIAMQCRKRMRKRKRKCILKLKPGINSTNYCFTLTCEFWVLSLKLHSNCSHYSC